MLVALPVELLVQVLALLATAADFARAATSCTACRNALEQAVRAHVLRVGLSLSEARPWLQLSPFLRIRMPWSFMLRVAEVRPRVLEAMGPHPTQAVHGWFYGKHDVPTTWCIAYEKQIIASKQRADAEEAAVEQQLAARAAKEAYKRAKDKAARERMLARMESVRVSEEAACSEDDDW